MAEVLDREGGDDRDRDVEIQRLNEMWNTPDDAFVSDAPVESRASIGDLVLQRSRQSYARIGQVATLRRAHIMPTVRGSRPIRTDYMRSRTENFLG